MSQNKLIWGELVTLLEKEIKQPTPVFQWRIPWTEEPKHMSMVAKSRRRLE